MEANMNNIHITTLYDPSLFWFLYEKDIPNRSKLSEELKKKYNECHFTIHKDVEEGMKVLVNYSDEWLRAEVALIKEIDSNKNEYICWLLDYGIFIEVVNVYKTLDLFKDIPPYAKKAKLFGLISIFKEYDVMSGKMKENVLKAWNPGVQLDLRECLTKPGITQYFTEKYSFNGFIYGTIYIKLPNEGLFDLKDKVESSGFGKYDEDLFSKRVLSNDALELKLRDVYKKAINMTNNSLLTQNILNDTDANFSLNLKKYPSKQSSPIITSGRGRHRLSSSSNKASSDSESSVLNNSTLTETSLKSSGRGFSKFKRISNKESSDNESSILNESVNKLSLTDSNLDLNSSREHSKISVIKNDNEIGVANVSKKKSSGRGFTKSLQVQLEKENDSINNEIDESRFEDCKTDTKEIKNINEQEKENEILNVSRSPVNSANKSISSETETSSVASTSSFKKSVFSRKKVVNEIVCCPAGGQYYNHPQKKIASDDDSSKSYKRDFREDLNPKRPPQNENTSVKRNNGEQGESESMIDENNKNGPPKQCKDCDTCKKTFDGSMVFEPTYVFEQRAPVEKKIIKPSLLFKNAEDDNKKVVIKNQKKDVTSVTDNLLAPRILVHSKFIIHPAEDLYTVPFHSEVQQLLRTLNYEKPTKIQQYAWPAIMRGQHVFLVGPKGTGKTMAYVPAICTFILTDIPDLPNVKGPIAIIICPGVKVAENIYNIINKLIKPRRNKNVCLVVPPFQNVHKTELSKGVDILICTPKTLVSMLKEKLISLKRLLYVVLENSRFLFDIFSMEIETIFKIFEKNLVKRKFGQSIQLIVVSQQWSKAIEQLSKKLKNTPSICICAYLEAALYGRTDIKIQFVEKADKPYNIIDILSHQSKVYKTVIIYNDKLEIQEALKYLESHGLDYEFLDGSEPMEDKRAVNRRWLNSMSGQHFILVCNDDVLNTDLAVTDAHIVIQYSLPSDSWSQFVYRFSSFLDNYKCPLIENNSQSTRCKMHIFLDGTNTEQFPRMYHFLQRMNCKMSDNIQTIYNAIVENIEENKRKNKVGLCYNLLSFGSCPDVITVCNGRHYLYEKADKLPNIPQSGIIKLKIVHVVSPILYYCRLLEHIDAENIAHKINNNYQFINTKLTKLMNSEQKKLVLEANVGGIYITEANGMYERCRLTKIIKKGVIQRASKVAVKLIDIGKHIDISTNDLYILPDYLKNIPPQAIEVSLSNLGPSDKDSFWSNKSLDIFQTKILKNETENNQQNCYFIGKIQLQLNNRLYVDNLVLQEIVESKPANITVNKLNIKSKLLKYNLVENRAHILEKLYALCKEFKITLPDYTLPVLKIENNDFKQIEPQWAHLENYEDYNEVYFTAAINPEQFFVKLCKNYNALNQLRKDITAAINKPFYPSKFPIVEGNCYLVKDSVENTYERVILKKIEGDLADCFFVDYGDHITVPISELKFIMDKHISQLPFQIIECKLYGINPVEEKWSSNATDLLYDLAHEPDTDLFRYLYVQVRDIDCPIHTGYKKYSILLIDSYDGNKIINNLLVEMNLAIKVCDEQLQFDVDKFKKNKNVKEFDDDSEIDSDFANNKNDQEVQTNKANFEELHYDNYADEDENDKWDLQVFDSHKFVAELFKFSSASKKLPALPESKTTEAKKITNGANSLPKLKALPPVDYCTPNIVWQQRDSDIKLKIHVIGVTHYELNIVHKKVLIFKTGCNGKVYKLNMRLYAPVATNPKHYIQGYHVIINMSKETIDNWPRLLLTTDRMPHITYNIDAINVEDSDEDAMPLEEMAKKSKETAKVDDDDTTFKYQFGSDEDYDESDVDSYESSD